MNPTSARDFRPPSVRREKLQTWHQELLYLMVAEPLLNQKELAERLGRHVVTVSQVQRSDIFKAKLGELRAAHEAEIGQRIFRRMDECIERSLKHIDNYLAQDEVDPRFALDTVEKLDRRRRGEKSVALHAHQHTIDPSIWERAKNVVREHASSEDIANYVSAGEESEECEEMFPPRLGYAGYGGE